MSEAAKRAAVLPRGLSRRDAAAYCGCATLSAFDDWVRREIVPGPMPGTAKWDRKAIDRALDKRSGLPSDSAEPSSPQAEAAAAYDGWRSGQHAH